MAKFCQLIGSPSSFMEILPTGEVALLTGEVAFLIS